MKNLAIIDLSNLKYNLELVRKLTRRPVIAVVKANAYGLGVKKIASTLQSANVYMMAVAIPEEGAELRELGVKTPILVFMPPRSSSDVSIITEYNLIPTVDTADTISLLSASNTIMDVHVKIDTGMHRLGLFPEKALELISNILSSPKLNLKGIYTHFATADTRDKEYLSYQLTIFNSTLNQLKGIINDSLVVHAANSGAILQYPQTYFDAVRPGIMLYGVYPESHLRNSLDLRPVLQLKSRIITIKQLKPGESVSYGRTFIAKDPIKIAIVPIGYADAIPVSLSNKGYFKVNGSIVPIIGRVTMDYTIIDVTNLKNVSVGDEVTIVDEDINVNKVSELADIIPYEFLTRLNFNRFNIKYIY